MTSVVNGGNFSTVLRERYCDGEGIPKPLMIPIGACCLRSGAVMINATTNVVGLGAIATNLTGIIWDSGAANTLGVRIPITLPSDYRAHYPFASQANIPSTEYPAQKKSGLILRLKMRKADADASDADDVTVRVTAHMQNPSWAAATDRTEEDGSAIFSLAAPVTALLEPTVLQADVDAFRWYEFDLGEAMTDAQLNALQPGATLNLEVSLDVAPGSADFVQLVGIELWYPAHPLLERTVDRIVVR